LGNEEHFAYPFGWQSASLNDLAKSAFQLESSPLCMPDEKSVLAIASSFYSDDSTKDNYSQKRG